MSVGERGAENGQKNGGTSSRKCFDCVRGGARRTGGPNAKAAKKSKVLNLVERRMMILDLLKLCSGGGVCPMGLIRLELLERERGRKSDLEVRESEMQGENGEEGRQPPSLSLSLSLCCAAPDFFDVAA